MTVRSFVTVWRRVPDRTRTLLAIVCASIPFWSNGTLALATTEPTTQSAQRVVTLAPHVTELVFAAGGGDKVVATVNSSNYPPEALDIRRIGDGLNVNAEQLLSLQPDLIVGWQNHLGMQKLTPVLADLDIAVVYSEPRLLDDIALDIERLGERLGTQAQARQTAAALRKQLSELRQDYSGRAPVSVFIEVGTGPLYTLGNDSLTNDAITSCGGINVSRESPLVAPTVTVERVLALNPDVVIIASRKPDHIIQRAHYWRTLQLPAALQHHIYGMDPDELLRPGPRLIASTHELCRHIDHARTH